jgi:hypothetical protein
VAGLGVDRLLDQIERNGADQHAGAEGHDQPDRRQADPESERDDGAQDERRGCEEPPAESGSHSAILLRERVDGSSLAASRLC